MATEKLTEAVLRKVSFSDYGKPTKISDGGGLYLYVKQTGLYWRLKYRLSGKQKDFAMGVYPDVSLKQARKHRDEAKRLIGQGIDPVAHRQQQRAENEAATTAAETVEAVTREWLAEVYSRKVAKITYDRNVSRLERLALPALGNLPIAEVTPVQVLRLLQSLSDMPETQNRIKVLLSMMFCYGVATGRAERDPTADLRGMTVTPTVQHQPALTEPDDVAGLLRAIDSYDGYPEVCAALKLIPMVFLRTKNLRMLRWHQVNFDEARLEIDNTKTGDPLVVPLADQAVAILREMEAQNRTRSEYVFPGARSAEKPMSDNGMLAALANMGYKDRHTGHGFRATARTLLVERLGYSVELVEMQLGHRVADVHGRAYNRTQFLEQRRKMMEHYADYLDALKAGDHNVVSIGAASR
mgnify:CR=1 FL=1